MKMKYFIDNIFQTSTELKNKKGQELCRFCEERYEHHLVNGDAAISVIMEELKHKLVELAGKYPRMLQMRVDRINGEFFNKTEIIISWVGKDGTASKCLSLNLKHVKGEINEKD